MNDIHDTTQTQSPPVAFCQNCGKPLTSDTARVVGPAVFCEPCLAARLAGAPTGTSGGYAPVNPASDPNAWAGQPAPLNSLLSPSPNPGLATLLGFIPGVGAMYNEQYAKGLVHLIVFVILVSLADNVNGVFGIFIAGWEFYMAIEAHHTARARRDGTPLPNPFGLNDIGERFGFGKSWPSGPNVAEVAHDAVNAAAAAANQTAAGLPYGFTNPPGPTPYRPDTGQAYAPPFTQPYAQPYAPPYSQPGYTPMPPIPPLPPLPIRSGFPAGAVWLIGLGILFLLTTTGIFTGFPGELSVGFLLIALAVWLFIRRMLETGAGFANDGTSAYPLRIFRALRGAVWLLLVGVLFLLNASRILPWQHSWPFFIILAGLVTLGERFAYQRSATTWNPPVNPTPQTESPATPTGGI